MNSIQLAQRLARNLAVKDTFSLPADAALDVLAAMNAGLGALYRKMPAIFKRTTLSHTVRAPRNLTVTFAAQYSRVVAADTFTSEEQGCTVRLSSGGQFDNVVTGPSSLLDAFLGTVLTQEATLYYDAAPIQDVIERIVGHVRLYDNTQSAPTVLIRDDGLRGSGVGGAWDGEAFYPSSAVGGVHGGRRSVGRPQYYFLEPVGVSQGGEPEFLLRFSPLPGSDYTVRLEAELSTQRMVFSDLSTAREINVPDAYLDAALIPLCEADLASSLFWSRKDDIVSVRERAADVLVNIMPNAPAEVAPVVNFVGTPHGY